MTVLRIDNLGIRFAGMERPAVDALSLELAAGETYCLLGESGSGKTLTALAVPALLPEGALLTGGRVEVCGQVVHELAPDELTRLRGGTVGFVFQEPQSALNPVMRVGEQVAEAVRRHTGLRGAQAVQAAIQLLERVGIANAAERYRDYPHQYSGGMKQRALIAMAIAGRPRLLIADEPTTALDVTLQAQVLALLRDLCREQDMALLFITHDLGVARQVAERVGVMQAGRLVEEAPVAELYAAPQSEYTRALFAAWPRRALRTPHEGVAKPAPVLEVAGLAVSYPGARRSWLGRGVPRRIINAVDFTLMRGETLAIVGESGSGKTTLARAVLGLVRPDGGRILLQGLDLARASGSEWRRARARLQIVFQDPYASMNPRMTIEQVVGEGLEALRIETRTGPRRLRVIRALEEVGLDASILERYPHEFSGGQRQRICIARALVLEPEVLVCDEPTSALDASVQWQILQLLKALQTRTGIAYLFITHNFSVVEYFADRVLVLHQGKVVETGTVDAILDRPEAAYTRALIASVPRWE
jgi:peptide/nickel transport system ATP-binding protein